MPSTFLFSFNQSHSVIPSSCTFSVPLPLRQKARIRREQRARAEQLGQQVFWVLDPSSVELMAIMYKTIGMVYILDLERHHWTSTFDGATLTQVLMRGDQWPLPPQARKLTDSEVELPRSLVEFPGFDQVLQERHRYGYSDAWQHFIATRGRRDLAPQSDHLPQSSITILGDYPVVLLKAPHMPLAFPAPSTIALGKILSPSFASPPAFATALVSRSSGCLQLLLSLSCRHPSRSKRVLVQRSRRNPLEADCPRHLAAATSALRCLSRAHSLPQP